MKVFRGPAQMHLGLCFSFGGHAVQRATKHCTCYVWICVASAWSMPSISQDDVAELMFEMHRRLVQQFRQFVVFAHAYVIESFQSQNVQGSRKTRVVEVACSLPSSVHHRCGLSLSAMFQCQPMRLLGHVDVARVFSQLRLCFRMSKSGRPSLFFLRIRLL